MESRLFGRTRVPLPVIGQGTWNMEADPEASVRALRRGLELGLSHVDTAELYGSGEVEELVGRALEGRRDRAYLVSKVLPTHGSFKGVLGACEASLRRLRTDRLDLYLLHWRDGEDLEEVVGGFERLVSDGKIRAWGVSNFDVPDLEEVERLAPGGAACNQVLYHLEERAVEHRVLPWCRERGLALVAYSPLGQGRLPRGPAIEALARARGATPAQLALARLAAEPGVFPIPKASRVPHVEENAAAGELELGPEERRALDEAFPRGPERPLPML